MSKICEEEKLNNQINVVIGAIAGGLLGAAAMYLLTREKEEEHPSMVQKIKASGRIVKDNVASVDWIDTAKDVLEAINEKVNPEEEVEEDRRSSTRLNDFVELATIGLRLWDNIKKRR